jgi:hypothetical protein
MDRRTHLLEEGWGMAPIYVGQQGSAGSSHLFTADQGTADGEDACLLAQSAGFPKRTVLYLALDGDGPLPATAARYLSAWASRVSALDYMPGVLCSDTSAATARGVSSIARLWVSKAKRPTGEDRKTPPFSEEEPSASGVPDAVAWRWSEISQISVDERTLSVHLDTAVTADPSTVEWAGSAVTTSATPSTGRLPSPKRGAFPTPKAELESATPYIPESGLETRLSDPSTNPKR